MGHDNSRRNALPVKQKMKFAQAILRIRICLHEIPVCRRDMWQCRHVTRYYSEKFALLRSGMDSNVSMGTRFLVSNLRLCLPRQAICKAAGFVNLLSAVACRIDPDFSQCIIRIKEKDNNCLAISLLQTLNSPDCSHPNLNGWPNFVVITESASTEFFFADRLTHDASTSNPSSKHKPNCSLCFQSLQAQIVHSSAAGTVLQHLHQCISVWYSAQGVSRDV